MFDWQRQHKIKMPARVTFTDDVIEPIHNDIQGATLSHVKYISQQDTIIIAVVYGEILGCISTQSNHACDLVSQFDRYFTPIYQSSHSIDGIAVTDDRKLLAIQSFDEVSI